jgi:hypothetical protein
MKKGKLSNCLLQRFIETLAPALVIDSQRKHSTHLYLQ